MFQNPNVYIFWALMILKKGLDAFVRKRVEVRIGADWEHNITRRFNGNTEFLAWDVSGLLKVVKVCWNQAFSDLGCANLAHVKDILAARNLSAHQHDFSLGQASRTLTKMHELLEAVGRFDGKAKRCSEEVKDLQFEMYRQVPSSSREAQTRTPVPKTTGRPPMIDLFEHLIQKVITTSPYRQHQFDSELWEMMDEAKNRGEEKVVVVSRELCYRVIDEYVDGVMVMSSHSMWDLWERQGGNPERVKFRSRHGFSNLLEIEFDTNNLRLDDWNA